MDHQDPHVGLGEYCKYAVVKGIVHHFSRGVKLEGRSTPAATVQTLGEVGGRLGQELAPFKEPRTSLNRLHRRSSYHRLLNAGSATLGHRTRAMPISSALFPHSLAKPAAVETGTLYPPAEGAGAAVEPGPSISRKPP